jgi:SanA protein
MTHLKKAVLGSTAIFIAIILFVVTVNVAILSYALPHIYVDATKIPTADVVLVLGARVYTNGNLSPILKDRVDTAMELYRAGKAKKFLVSGDHGRKNYDEVNTVKQYLLEVEKIPAEDVFLDHAGFDTYDSIYRARDIFQIKKIIVPTQNFHLPRAVYIGNKLGIETYGISADKHIFANEKYNEFREVFARVKTWMSVFFHAKPKFLGTAIPVNGDSQKSWD